MRRIFSLLTVIACMIACSNPSDPEKALQSYARAVTNRQCDEALRHLSARTRQAIEALTMEAQNRSSTVSREEYYCSRFTFEHCKWEETTLDEKQADTAKVSMSCGHTQDSILPGFSSIFLKYEPRVTDLVYEEGEWRVTIPHVIRKFEVEEKER